MSHQAQSQDTSSYNVPEVVFVRNFAQMLCRDPEIPEDLSIAILTPYSRQCVEIKKIIDSDRIKVLTVDSSQGLEWDIIILSVTRTESLGFMQDPHRVNVALTRAKKAMYICGSLTSITVGIFFSF